MDFIVTDPDPLLDTFFDNFASLWSRPNQAEGFRAYALRQGSWHSTERVNGSRSAYGRTVEWKARR